MLRPTVLLAFALGAIAVPASAQGIRGVTRRTPTLEFQQPARQFFDAAGISTTGADPAAAGGSASAATQVRPAPQPLLATKPVPSTRAAPPRPYVLGPVKSGPATNVSRLVSQPQPQPQPRPAPVSRRPVSP